MTKINVSRSRKTLNMRTVYSSCLREEEEEEEE